MWLAIKPQFFLLFYYETQHSHFLSNWRYRLPAFRRCSTPTAAPSAPLPAALTFGGGYSFVLTVCSLFSYTTPTSTLKHITVKKRKHREMQQLAVHTDPLSVFCPGVLMLSPDPTSDKTGIRCSASGVPRHTNASLNHYQPLTVNRRSLMSERKKKIAPYRRHRSVLVDASS